MDDNWKPRKAERLICREEDGTLLLFDSHSGDIQILNKTAEYIWNTIDGNTPVSDIIETVAKKNPQVEKQTIRDDVYRFLKELQEFNFIED
ncbi:MAG: PqqD family protein [Theionarchaea archaeon]|nr:MAG: hypothetical protein AYK19_16110 [Theionarchaea archaeon DG-70-1]MBU7029477.1 PqqD family protein [Theionarchaea archaeon]